MFLLLIAVMALAPILIFFYTQKRAADERWQRYKQLKEQHRSVRREQTINPDFVFDEQETNRSNSN